MQIINIAISFTVYYPFFRKSKKKNEPKPNRALFIMKSENYDTLKESSIKGCCLMNEVVKVLEVELGAILNASNDNIVITDGEGIVLKASRNCEDIYGRPLSEIIGKSVFDLQSRSVFSPSVTARVIQEKKEIQVMQTTSAGKSVMATGIPIMKNGEIFRIISFSHDLTEIRRLKEDYEQLQSKMRRYEKEIQELKNKTANSGEVVINSDRMEKLWVLLNRVAASDANVVLLGESGVGKTAFARALHQASHRKAGPFIEVNCGAIPENLFESEMFGYQGGAFTGANQKGKAGMIELAQKGTLFLDEVGELPFSIQVKLLKVLQEKRVTRIGGITGKHVDFRLVSASNQNLEELVQQGKFREDLFYRLNVVPITIPPLRERKEEIDQLMMHFLEKFNQKYGTSKFFHAEVFPLFLQYHWPGNVRELENMIERIIVTTDTNTIYPKDIGFLTGKTQADYDWSSLFEFNSSGGTLQDALKEVEKAWLKRAYRQCKTTYEMADILGISQATVVRRLKKYKIDSK